MADGDPVSQKQFYETMNGVKTEIINKIDILSHLNFNIDKAVENSLKINPQLKVFKTSCITDEGIDHWCEWLKNQVKK